MRVLPPAHVRRGLAERLEERLTPAMSALGVLFLLVVLAQPRARPGSVVADALAFLGWLLWAAFALEYAVRLTLADDRPRFLRRTWWQLLFLALPFLRLFRLVHLLRVARAGRVLSSAIRGTRSAGQVLSSRLGWLTSTTLIAVLAGSQLLDELGEVRPYGQALYVAALAVIAGETFGARTGLGRVVEVALLTFSVGVFATLAGTLGAFFLEPRRSATAPAPEAPPAGDNASRSRQG